MKHRVNETSNTITAYIKDFEFALMENEKSPLTIEKYLRDVRYFLVWLGERELVKAEVLAYKAHLVEHYAATSVNSMLSSLAGWLKFIGRGDCCVKTLKLQRTAFCTENRELSREEYVRLLKAAAKDERLQLLMQTIATTGIRVSEHKFITVEAAKRGLAEVRCKGKIRTILLPRKLCKTLLAYTKKQGIRTGCIFCARSGKPMDRSSIWAKMKKLCKAAKVLAEKVFPHNLRHLFARTFYSIEKDVVRLADILGHSSVNTTRIYTTESGSVHRQQIEKIPLLMIT